MAPFLALDTYIWYNIYVKLRGMRMDKKVSVIVPVFNAEENIKRCLDSLVNQTLKDIEIIIVNSSSVDETEYIINEYIKNYPDKIKHFKVENNGKAHARNVDVTKVTAPFFMFVDVEDYLELEACEELYKEALKSNYDIVTCDGFYYHLATDYKEEITFCDEFSDSEEKNYLVSNFKPWGKIFNTYFWKSNNIKFNECIEYEDLAIIPALAAYAKKIYHVKRPLYNVLQNKIVSSDAELYIKSIKDIFKALVILESEITTKKKFDEYKEEIEYLYIKHLLFEATTMFLKCENTKEDINKIVDIMRKKFPGFKWNTYYVQREFKFRLACRLIYKRRYGLVKKLLKI